MRVTLLLCLAAIFFGCSSGNVRISDSDRDALSKGSGFYGAYKAAADLQMWDSEHDFRATPVRFNADGSKGALQEPALALINRLREHVPFNGIQKVVETPKLIIERSWFSGSRVAPADVLPVGAERVLYAKVEAEVRARLFRYRGRVMLVHNPEERVIWSYHCKFDAQAKQLVSKDEKERSAALAELLRAATVACSQKSLVHYRGTPITSQE